LLDDRSWLLGFAMETSGFLLYAAALAFVSLVFVQSIAAGGIVALAYVSARVSGRRLGRRELSGVLLVVLGLVALGVSLARAAVRAGTARLPGSCCGSAPPPRLSSPRLWGDRRRVPAQCARMDSNHHGEISPQGPQPDRGGVDGFRGVQIVHFAKVSGRAGRIRQGGCCHGVATD
jgi:hypothetical protein